jgi:hypothetical protein
LQGGNGPILWLRVGSHSAEQVYHALAGPFGEVQTIATAFHSGNAAAALQDLLDKSRATLLVFDDVWWNRRAFGEVLQTLPKQLPIVATSRQRFSDMSAIHDVADLELADALALLGHHAHGDYSDDETMAEVCRRLGGHAFSIERAGKLLERRRWSSAKLLEAVSQDAPQTFNIPDYGSKERVSVQSLEISMELGKLLNSTNERIFILWRGRMELAEPRLTKMASKDPHGWKNFLSDAWGNDPGYIPLEEFGLEARAFFEKMLRELFGDHAKLPGKPGSPDRV